MMNPLSLKGSPAPTTGWQNRILATVTHKASTASTPPPSVQVTLGASASDASDTYSLGGQDPATRYSNDALSAMLQRNAGSQSASSLFAGLGKALLSRLGADGSDVSLNSAAAKDTTKADGIAPPMLGATANASLTVKLASGASVTLSLSSGVDGLSIDMRSSSPLGEEDRQSVAKLGGAFQDMLDGLGSTPPKLSLQGLTEGDSRIASVDFKATVPAMGDATQKIDFHSGADARSVKVDGPGGSINVDMDMSNAATWGNQAQRKASISNYLDQIDVAANRGNGDKDLVALFKSAFGQLNASYPPSPTTGPNDGVRALNASDHAALTGLADFKASIGQTASSSNPLHPEEMDSFSYELSQSTQLGGKSATDRTIDQHLSSHLKASYHMALAAGLSLQLTRKPESQNYIYRQVDDSSSSDTHLSYTKGRLTEASVTQSASQTTHDKKYVMAKLMSDTTMPSSRTHTQDLLALLAPPRKDGDDPRQPPVSQATLDRVHAMTGLVSEPWRISAG